ncbi:MAG: hypothetical protein UIM25_02695 [Bacteroidales bacterium]|nr:hypothetical protein [Bacteroidales bacterium]
MKRIIFAICTILCANVLFAQEQLATLRHNDSISVYYGANAFVQAYNAATHGDIITLSDGIFSTPSSVQKGITVRGNGAVADTARRSTGTYFMTSFPVYNLGDSLDFEAEGIYFNYFSGSNSYGIKLTRCAVKSISSVYGAQMTNCIILDNDADGNSSRQNTYINCVVKDIPYYSICNNCILRGTSSSSGTSMNTSQFNNCILINNTTSNDTINLYQTANNSILCRWDTIPNYTSSGNVSMNISDVFENWDGATFTFDHETYKLKTTVSDTVVGLDGTEVGIFGGFMPFDWRPTYSVIKRCNVANRTTADGKLSVDIEVITE